MTIGELAKTLGDRYACAPTGDKVLSLYLFGVEYADTLEGVSLKSLFQEAFIPESYGAELSRARRLAGFVAVKT
jgi:hypothetical protein